MVEAIDNLMPSDRERCPRIPAVLALYDHDLSLTTWLFRWFAFAATSPEEIRKKVEDTAESCAFPTF